MEVLGISWQFGGAPSLTQELHSCIHAYDTSLEDGLAGWKASGSFAVPSSVWGPRFTLPCVVGDMIRCTT